MVETKVTAATAASPVAALVVFLVALLGRDMSTEAALGLIVVLTPVLTFAGGYLKASRTSRVSDEFVPRGGAHQVAESAERRAARERHPSSGEGPPDDPPPPMLAG